ncbi:MAG: HAD family hydrolase [Anaerolineae bacterium]
MIRALLFDLDGTLLDNDMETFLPPYFEALTKRLAQLIPPDQLITQILASTSVMMANTDPTKTNQQVFLEDFFPKIGYPAEELMPLFDEFYANDYPKLQRHVRKRPEARSLMETIFRAGYSVVIATDPVFPLTAVQQRLQWAGVSDFPYALVTSYENMHFCKPHGQYYQEVAQRIGRETGQCLMVGNDLKRDIVPAARVGMRTFLVAERPPESLDATTNVDLCGSLTDLSRLIKQGALRDI